LQGKKPIPGFPSADLTLAPTLVEGNLMYMTPTGELLQKNPKRKDISLAVSRFFILLSSALFLTATMPRFFPVQSPFSAAGLYFSAAISGFMGLIAAFFHPSQTSRIYLMYRGLFKTPLSNEGLFLLLYLSGIISVSFLTQNNTIRFVSFLVLLAFGIILVIDYKIFSVYRIPRFRFLWLDTIFLFMALFSVILSFKISGLSISALLLYFLLNRKMHAKRKRTESVLFLAVSGDVILILFFVLEIGRVWFLHEKYPVSEDSSLFLTSAFHRFAPYITAGIAFLYLLIMRIELFQSAERLRTPGDVRADVLHGTFPALISPDYNNPDSVTSSDSENDAEQES
jgi:hypothetical protein